MRKYFKIGLLFTLVFWAHSLVAQDTIPMNTFYSFEAKIVPGYSYSWWYVDEANNKTYFTSSTNKTEDYYWDTEGEYQLFVQASDANNCLSEIISKNFVVFNKTDDLGKFAGRDTTIGSCTSYILGGQIEDEEKYNFLWKPAENLDNAASARPIFTPGESTEFSLILTNKITGYTTSDSVVVTVSEIVANAGDDILMDRNSTAILDGSRSTGNSLQFFWTTNNGNIESGENTPTPIVSKNGTYYLEVQDLYGCFAIDSVEVSLLTFAPIANDDYDTVAYQETLKIDVLANDTDSEGDIDPTTLNISQSPINGSATVDFSDYSIIYTPDIGFTGNDVFEYSICDSSGQCDNAHVYVMVNGFKFFIPDAFSPNGDNINDYFEIEGINYYEGNSIEIINRWGKKVYEAKNYGIDSNPLFWNGKSNTGTSNGNEELPTGIYFYVLDLGNGQQPIAGSVYIDR